MGYDVIEAHKRTIAKTMIHHYYLVIQDDKGQCRTIEIKKEEYLRYVA